MSRRQHAMHLIAVVAAIACSDPHEGNASSSAEEGGIETTAQGGSASTTDDASSSSSEEVSSAAAAPEDPSYPPPSPIDELGTCPSGFLGPITFDGEGWGCIPACDADGMCPAASDGTPGECATNPASSATPCMDWGDCTIEGEMCGNAGMNRMACLLPPSHCIVRCEDGAPCPEPMTCATSVGVCQYVP